VNVLGLIRSTARVSDFLFRRLPAVYVPLYNAYKRRAERDAVALLRRLVEPGSHVADVGANIGFYTELLAQTVGERGRVWAFEPEPFNFQRLQTRVRRYPQVHPVRAAASGQSGEATLYLSPDLNIDHRTYPTAENRSALAVEAVTLDDFFRSSNEVLQFVKIDVQGAEYSVLLGMRDLLARSPDVRLLVELWPFVHDRYGVGTGRLLDLLESWGFDVWRLGPGGRPAERLAAGSSLPERENPNAYFDVLCVRPQAMRLSPDGSALRLP
jgi:FkbM family methyltransferase